jgi:SAM-dependent methyltransferase
MSERNNKVRDHFDRLSADIGRLRRRYRHCHEDQTNYLRYLVPEGKRVLELGCGNGDLLNSLKPSHGVGVDLSPGMAERERHEKPAATLGFPGHQNRTTPAISRLPPACDMVAETSWHIAGDQQGLSLPLRRGARPAPASAGKPVGFHCRTLPQREEKHRTAVTRQNHRVEKIAFQVGPG